MYRPVAAFRRFHARSVDYFTHFQERVTRVNLRQLRAAAVTFALFLLLYGLLTAALFRNPLLARCYLAAGAAELLFLPFAFLQGRRGPPSYRAVQTVCMLFILVVMAFTIALSIFPYPEDPGIFFPLAYMLVIVLFLLPYQQAALLLTGSAAAYVLMVLAFKTPGAIKYDVFAGVTTWALGFFFLYVVTDLRLRDGERLRELDEQCRTDPLTGLPNRRLVEGDMARSYRRCQRAGLWAAVIMLDVDDFKAYNDLLGHPEGDECLRALSGAIQAFADEQGIYAARYGGEEFVFFLPGCSEEEVQRTAAQMLSRIRALKLPFPGRGNVTVSVGLAAQRPGPEDSWADLLRRADQALYRSKAGGKDRMELWR